MLAPYLMDRYNIFNCRSLLTRRNLDRDKLGNEIPKIYIDVVTTELLLIDRVYNGRTICRVIGEAPGMRFIMWSYEVNRGGLVAAVLNMLKLDLRKRQSGVENEGAGTKEIITIESVIPFPCVAKVSKDLFVGGWGAWHSG